MSDYIAIIIVVVLVVIYFSKRNRKIKQKGLISKYLSELPKFTVSKEYIGVDVCSGIAIDERQRKICFITNINNEITHKIIDYKDILSSKILEDGKDVVKTSREELSTTKVSNIALQIIIKDLDNPNRVINFIHLEDKKNFIHRTAIEQAREQVRLWYNIISAIINQTDEKDNTARIDMSVAKRSK